MRRMATMRRMAEFNMGDRTMKGISGHSRDEEAARYTAEANQECLAREAVGRLVAWESLPPEKRQDVMALAAMEAISQWESPTSLRD